ncbi:hypothetical protein KP509_21G053900 [Ceratopteris richardii]|uniref:Uncharacterized protein n=1 Tax=Ceratopteris richardii TaxID=49495 RepID=A0A8T2SDM4_CERRI|nr:hypothetical protein KP509_21G053900 [Ceratopteris richardii]
MDTKIQQPPKDTEDRAYVYRDKHYSEMDPYKEAYIIARFNQPLQTKMASSPHVTLKASTSHNHVPLASH